MINIQLVLERYGAWVASNPDSIGYAHIAAGFKGLIPNKVKSRPACCDDDGLLISGCMARLNKADSTLHDLLIDYYVFGYTFMQLAKKNHCSDTYVGKRLQKGEGIIEGMLMMLNVKLQIS